MIFQNITMNRKNISMKLFVLLLAFPLVMQAQETGGGWTLDDCISYALANNIQLKRSHLTRLSTQEDILQSKAALLPSLNASTNQSVTYRPFVESGQSTVANGYVQSSIDKVYYNGSYGVTANWTVWDGMRNKNTIKLNEMNARMAELDSAATAQSIQEQITQLYVQILYSKESITVNEQSLRASKMNEERGQTMVQVGTMSKADLAQLTAQRAMDEYNIVAAESDVRNYLFQLKQVLELSDGTPFDIASPDMADEEALQTIPALSDVYASALAHRPEIESARLAISSSDISLDIARAGRKPTIGLQGSVGTTTTSMSDNAWGTQLKTNLDFGVGATLSIPIFDNRQTKTAINKAILHRESSLLDLQDKEKQLYSTIEGYWIGAVNNQTRFKAARTALQSEQTSYELLSEQFRLGLKNIIELMTGKTNLVTAQINELQSKYMAILNIYMLRYYQGR